MGSDTEKMSNEVSLVVVADSYGGPPLSSENEAIVRLVKGMTLWAASSGTSIRELAGYAASCRGLAPEDLDLDRIEPDLSGRGNKKEIAETAQTYAAAVGATDAATDEQAMGVLSIGVLDYCVKHGLDFSSMMSGKIVPQNMDKAA